MNDYGETAPPKPARRRRRKQAKQNWVDRRWLGELRDRIAVAKEITGTKGTPLTWQDLQLSSPLMQAVKELGELELAAQKQND